MSAGRQPFRRHPDDPEVIQLPLAQVMAMAFSSTGAQLATGSRRAAQLWDLETRRAAGPVLEHPTLVLALAFNPDGSLLATGVFMTFGIATVFVMRHLLGNA